MSTSRGIELDRFAEFSGKWEKRYPAIIRLWENAWAEFVPFLRFDRESVACLLGLAACEAVRSPVVLALQANIWRSRTDDDAAP